MRSSPEVSVMVIRESVGRSVVSSLWRHYEMDDRRVSQHMVIGCLRQHFFTANRPDANLRTFIAPLAQAEFDLS